MVAGAIFGGITLVAFFGLAILADEKVICKSFPFLSAVFALGAALAAGYIGGGAAAQGTFGSAAQDRSMAFSAGGGVAVLIIVFFVFNLFKPQSCPVAKFLFDFRGIPPDYSVSVHELFSRDTNDDSPRGDRPPRRVTVLIQDEALEGKLTIQGSPNQQCGEIPIYSYTKTTDLQKLSAEYEIEHVSVGEARSVKIHYTDPSRGPKAGFGICFKYGLNKPVLALGGAAQHGAFVIGTAAKEPRSPDAGSSDRAWIEKNPVAELSSGSPRLWTQSIGLISQVFAQGGTYAQLKPSLASKDPAIRIKARQYLEANFERYATEALNDLFVEGQESFYVESILYGLIAGIGTRNDKLLPGKQRDLDLPLPYVAGQEAKLVELTAHPADGVKKRARWLIQKFPVNAFDPIFKKMIGNAIEGNCDLGGDRERAQSILYAGIFYQYNRIVENMYYRPSKSRADDAEERAGKVRMMADKCLDPSLAIDAALVTYGRARMYSLWNSQWGGYKQQALEAARQFLSEIKGKEADYYLPPHITQMKTLESS